MTGFGQAELETERFTVKAELKSLNSKFLELSIRMPRNWQHKELELRREVSKWLERGTAQLNIQINYKLAQDRITPINREIALYYLNEVKTLSQESGWEQNDLLNNIFLVPNVLQTNDETPNEEDWKQIMQAVRNAYVQFDAFRLQEGSVIKNELSKISNGIFQKMQALAPFEEERLQTVKERILRELQSLAQENVDKNRFEQELIYYIEKLDISEEKLRLKQHCDFFEETLNLASSGKKLNFIAQEMGREINTIGSKSNHHLMQRSVVEMKDELEKIKEQINNVL
ncbi:MAG: YicC family protein [Bacteroidia bacterium]|nr:YicC family protein [Bacteroidia bacterium]MCF8447414.1 YicC family protein [Bacteroidia bacterium]